MALIQVNYVSAALQRTVPVQVILPVDKLLPGGKLPPVQKFKTLYLLNGFLGNYTDWVTGTRIQRWAQERDLAVVMPSGDNSFYVDAPGNAYGRFVGQELVEMTRRMFPLSRKREDTFIGGLSMGGFGAMRNGLKYANTFGTIISLSGAFHMFDQLEKSLAAGEDVSFQQHLLGDLRQAAVSDKNPQVLVERLAKRMAKDPKTPVPAIYMACGTEDFLLEDNRKFCALLRQKGFDLTYEESPGAHDWDFWDTYILKVLSWLPLQKTEQGRNSGNVN